MIRFRIAGSGYLELPSDFDFSFNFNNGIFSFDNMQLSRSGEFRIPRTPANDVILGFSHDPSNHGLDVRRTIRAELFYSGGKINGSLFIGKYTAGTGYSAVFVYGELSGLKRIQELGTIDNYAVVGGSIPATNTDSSYYGSGVFEDVFSFYNYKNGIPDASKLTTHFNHFPTVKLSYLLSQSAQSAGVTVDTSVLGVAVDAVGLILSTNNANPTLQSVSVTGAANLSLAISGAGVIHFDIETRVFPYFVFDYQSRELRWANIRVLVCKDDLTIVTSVASSSTAIITADGTFDGSNYGTSGITYLSDGDFYGFRHIYEGQRISLKKGDFFTFIELPDTRSSYYPINAYTTPIASGVTFDVYVGELATVDVNEDYFLQYNLPKVTLLDLVKTFANIFYCGITYNATTNTIGFFNFVFNKSNRKKLDDDVIAVKSVSRSFYDYAQKNYIKFKNEDYVTESRAQTIYTISNDSLPKEKTLYTIPFSEGIKNELGEVVINDFELSSPYKKTAKIGTLAVPSVVSGENNLKHISELYNYQYADKTSPWTNNLTPIIRNSTTMEMTVKMDVANFLNMENEDVYSYRGKDYVCIAGTHSGQIAELTLIKI